MNVLDAIRGYKTFAATGAGVAVVPEVVHQLLVPFLASHDIVVGVHGEVWIVGLCMGAIAWVMRLVTTTPPGKQIPPFVQPSSETSK